MSGRPRMDKQDVFVIRSNASKANWQRLEYRLHMVKRRQEVLPTREHSMAAISHARTPEAAAKAAERQRAAFDAAAARQQRMLGEMASRANVGPEMRDVVLMREWMSWGIRQSTLCRWLGVPARTLSGWARGTTPVRVRKIWPSVILASTGYGSNRMVLPWPRKSQNGSCRIAAKGSGVERASNSRCLTRMPKS